MIANIHFLFQLYHRVMLVNIKNVFEILTRIKRTPIIFIIIIVKGVVLVKSRPPACPRDACNNAILDIGKIPPLSSTNSPWPFPSSPCPSFSPSPPLPHSSLSLPVLLLLVPILLLVPLSSSSRPLPLLSPFPFLFLSQEPVSLLLLFFLDFQN